MLCSSAQSLFFNLPRNVIIPLSSIFLPLRKQFCHQKIMSIIMKYPGFDSLALLLVASPALLNLLMIVCTLFSVIKRQHSRDQRLLKKNEENHGISRGVLFFYIGEGIIFIADNLGSSVKDWPYRETTAVCTSVSSKATLDAANQEHRSISVPRFLCNFSTICTG